MDLPPPAVRITELRKSFGTVQALKGISFDVRPGEVFALLGPNGAGKSTTIRILVTLGGPSSGTAEVFGFDVRKRPMEVRRRLGYVPQMLSIEGALTGRENVTLFARLYNVPRHEVEPRSDEVLRLLGLEDAQDRLASTYSGGMVRRLELAQALVHHPPLLVLDEPTVGLDPVARSDLWGRLKALQKSEGTTVLISTHYMEEAEEHADRVALLHRGELRALGTPRALMADLGEGRSLEDVFRSVVEEGTPEEPQGGMRDVRSVRRTVRRVA